MRTERLRMSDRRVRRIADVRAYLERLVQPRYATPVARFPDAGPARGAEDGPTKA